MAENQTPFVSAVRAYVATPSKKKKATFVQRFLENGAVVKPDEVQGALLALEKENSQRTTRRLLRPVFEALLDYDGVIGTLAQADPMPSALIWGGLKALLECFSRYNNLYEKIEGQLKKLTHELGRLKDYESLFNKSEDMQELLTSSYLNVIKFWARVEEQCSTSGFMLAAKALTSFATKKLNEILADIAKDSDNIAKLVPIIQERLRRGDREDAANERRRAGIVLDELLKAHQEEREARRRSDVRLWIRNRPDLNESNTRRQHQRDKELHQGTGNWLFENASFNKWLAGDSHSNIMWLNGGPGVGKSVICARAVREIRTQHTSSAVAFHYFSFDETDTAPTIYRNIAEQLFLELYYPKGEISDEVYELVQNQANEGSLKELIKVFVAELQSTYIFIDGLDEEYADRSRWADASGVVSFLIDLVRQPDSSVKLWCSSQDRGRIRELMDEAEQIELSASINSQDIETLFVSALQKAEYGELDSQTKSTVLDDLKRQVNGNFLWASLMLHTISDVPDMKELQAKVKEGLPEDFEKYLERKIRNLKKAQHGFLSKVLSCLVYARRPMFLEELCEAVEISDHPPGEDLDSTCRVFRSRILDSCAPLARVDIVNTKAKCKEICTLSHGSVKTFLVKNPSVLSSAEGCQVSSKLLADSCLKYLQQPRYKKQLVRGTGTFTTASKQDILDHYLLNYCAKYWHKHMDDMVFSSELCKRVEDFVKSTNFATLLQVQSLFVGGQFSFWYSWGQESKGRHLVRVLPRWFTERHRCGEDLRLQYHSAIGEWGYYLDQISTITGTYPGQIDRCLWGSLGKSNFLHKIPSPFKSFAFENTDEALDSSTLFFEWVDESGKELCLFKLNLAEEEGRESQVTCERWALGRGRSPKMKGAYTISIPIEEFQLYRMPLKRPLSRKAGLMEISEDGRLLRIGSRLYVREEDFEFTQIHLPWEQHVGYVDELGCSHRGFAAVASRQKISTADPKSPDDDTDAEATKTTGNQRTDDASESQEGSTDDSSTSSSESDNESGNDGEDREEILAETKSETASSDSLSIKYDLDEEQSESLSIPEDVDDLDSDSAESNSARESWSEGSTAHLSDEIEDEIAWNDYASDEDSLDLTGEEDFDLDDADEDDGPDLDEVSEAGSLETSGSSGKTDASWKQWLKSNGDDTPSSSNPWDSESSGVESEIEPSDESDDPTDDDSNASSQGGLMLERLLQSAKQDGATHTSEIRIFKLGGDKPTERIFRFFKRTSGLLFSSPPVFHPTRDLVVWPLGGDEVLFANFTEKTYFIRLVSSGYANGCHISVQCRFSPCGQYLHMASLDGWKERNNISNITISSMVLRMHVSTHRLSKGKTARSPPRLVFRTSVSLGLSFSETEKLSVSNLPHSITWTEDHLYVTVSGTSLTVFRMPLFRQVEAAEKGMYSRKAVFRNVAEVFLPASAAYRKVHFFPGPQKASPDATTGSKSRKKARPDDKPEFAATVFVGSRNPEKEKGLVDQLLGGLAGGERVPPQGVHLTTAQFGGWEPAEPRTDDIKMLKRAETWRGGQLLAKFEKFDRSEDCDIVPYLGL